MPRAFGGAAADDAQLAARVTAGVTKPPRDVLGGHRVLCARRRIAQHDTCASDAEGDRDTDDAFATDGGCDSSRGSDAALLALHTRFMRVHTAAPTGTRSPAPSYALSYRPSITFRCARSCRRAAHRQAQP